MRFPVILRNICKNVVDTEVGPVRKHSPAVGAVLGLFPSPVVAEAGQAEAVSTRYGDRTGENVSAQEAQKVLL